MAHSSEKEGDGRLGRNEDHSSVAADNYNEPLEEEITALSSIYGADFKIVSGPPTIIITIRPHSKDTTSDSEDSDISVQLSVCRLEGYPDRCPELKITLEKGLKEGVSENLMFLLRKKANEDASKGRETIINLVEVAKDFLSQIDSEHCSTSDTAPSNSVADQFVGPEMKGSNEASSAVPEFWKSPLDLEGPAIPNSRYRSDFEELRRLGKGGFGSVALCKNKFDKREYAVKKIPKDKSLAADEVPREVATLAGLQHQRVVRYYQSWMETGMADSSSDGSQTSLTAASSTLGGEASNSTCLYIQMEYCPRTLRQVLEDSYHVDGDSAWRWFRQIVEGLAWIHGAGIMHRDLNPSNIFLDARNEIKIADFGLAKSFMLEQLDHEPALPTSEVFVDGTPKIGTELYNAPEMKRDQPSINEKVDMYSLGIILFELWHPFGTNTERCEVLSGLKQDGYFPPSWDARFQEQALLVKRLISTNPRDRPSATDLLNVPLPRMESKLLDGEQLTSNHNLQADFDVVGGTSPLTEALTIKGVMDIVTHCNISCRFYILLNHADLLNAIWAWVGVELEDRQRVGELLLPMMASLQSPGRMLKWEMIHQQLLQENMPAAVLGRLKHACFRFHCPVGHAIHPLREALKTDNAAQAALDTVLELSTHLRRWGLEDNAYIVPLILPTDKHHKSLFFQVYMLVANNPSGLLVAVGGRKDNVVQRIWCDGSVSQ